METRSRNAEALVDFLNQQASGITKVNFTEDKNGKNITIVTLKMETSFAWDLESETSLQCALRGVEYQVKTKEELAALKQMPLVAKFADVKVNEMVDAIKQPQRRLSGGMWNASEPAGGTDFSPAGNSTPTIIKRN